MLLPSRDVKTSTVRTARGAHYRFVRGRHTTTRATPASAAGGVRSGLCAQQRTRLMTLS